MNFLLAALIGFLFTPHTQEVDITTANKVLNQSVLIRIKQYKIDNGGIVHRGLGGCSGTYIGQQTVLTAAHCFSNPTTNIWIRGYGTISREAILVKIDVPHDLALLSVKGPYKHSIAKLAASPLTGSKVINVGSPFGMEFLLSEGIVSRIEFTISGFKANYLITTAMINPGSSGGGAFNADGDLIGVNVMTIGGLFGWAGISAAVDLYTIREFLR